MQQMKIFTAVFCLPFITMQVVAMDGATETISGSGRVFAEAVNLHVTGAVTVPNANIHAGTTYNFSSDSTNTPRDQQLPVRDRFLNAVEAGYIQMLAALAVQVPIELLKMAVVYGFNRLTADKESDRDEKSNLIFALRIQTALLKEQAELLSELEKQVNETQPSAGHSADDVAQLREAIRTNIDATRKVLLQKTCETSDRMREFVTKVPAAA